MRQLFDSRYKIWMIKSFLDLGGTVIHFCLCYVESFNFPTRYSILSVAEYSYDN